MSQNASVFEENFHMSVAQFEDLYKLLFTHLIPKVASRPLDAISPKEKLAVVLE